MSQRCLPDHVTETPSEQQGNAKERIWLEQMPEDQVVWGFPMRLLLGKHGAHHDAQHGQI